LHGKSIGFKKTQLFLKGILSRDRQHMISWEADIEEDREKRLNGEADEGGGAEGDCEDDGCDDYDDEEDCFDDEDEGFEDEAAEREYRRLNYYAGRMDAEELADLEDKYSE